MESRRGALLCALAVLAVLAVDQARAQEVRCFTTEDECSSPSSTDFFVAPSLRECCLDSRGFYARVGGPTNTSCDQCIVFGLLENGMLAPSMITLVESERRDLTVGYLKGAPGFYGFMVVASGGGGNTTDSDFRVTPIGPIMLSSFQPGSVQLLAEVDTVALEPVEFFTLTIVLTGNQIPANAFAPRSAFLHFEITVWIVDASDVLVNFFEADFGSIEDSPITVRLTLTAPIATDLDVRIRMMNLTQVFELTEGEVARRRRMIPLPDDFPDPGVFNPRRPYIASSVDQEIAKVDYNISDIFIHIDATNAITTNIQVEIALVDDTIDEASMEFFVMMLETDDPRVNLTNGQFAARGNIGDNDGITVGFERISYTFSEERLSPLVRDEVFIIKQDNQTSELTYDITVESFPGTALNNIDFVAAIELDEDFIPTQQRIPVNFRIIPDDAPEGIETFSFQLRNNDPDTTFTNDPRETTISIFDTDNVIVAFSQTEFTVSEDVGEIQLCLVMIVPPPGAMFNRVFPASVETRDGTAIGGQDFDVIDLMAGTTPTPIHTFSSTNRDFCFNVTITNDMRFEAHEVFTVVAREDPPFYGDLESFIIQNDTVTIWINDTDRLAVGFQMPNYTVLENTPGYATVVVELRPGPGVTTQIGTDVVVRVSTADFNPPDAVASVDYTPVNTTITFTENGVLEMALNINITNDNFSEGVESFLGNLMLVASTGPASRITIFRPETVVIIEDDDSITIGFDPTIYSFAESENATARLVIISGAFAAGVSGSVQVTSASGTATSGMDFTAVSQTYTFSDTVVSNDVTVILNDDNLNERDEQFSLLATSLSSGVAIASGADTANITIIDNDYTRIGFEPVVYSVLENASFVRLSFRAFTDSGVLTEDVTVRFSTSDDSAVAGSDYISVDTFFTFTAGLENEEISIDILIVNDTTLENLEQFFANLVLSTTPLNVTVEPSRATISIVDEDDVVIGFDPDTYSVDEEAGVVTFVVRVLEGSLMVPVTVQFITSNGNAIAGSDYVSRSVNITFTDSVTEISVNVTILPDLLWEFDETFFGSLSPVTSTADVSYVITPALATVVITDNDAATIGFNPETYSGPEGSTVILTIEVINGQLGREVVVFLNTNNGTATGGGVDYMSIVNEALAFSASVLQINVSVAIIEDNLVEIIEDFTALLTNPNLPRLTVAPDTATVSIPNDDVATIGFTQTVYNIIESAGRVEVTVALTPPGELGREVEVILSTVDGAAISFGPEADYRNTTVTLVFSPTATSFTVPVFIIDDSYLENDEPFRTVVNLATADPSITITPNSATITILNDDSVIIGFVQSEYDVLENQGILSIPVRIRGPNILRRSVTFNVTTQDGSAQAGSDYSTTTATVTFDSSVGEFFFNIPILTDGVLERTEDFTATISSLDADVLLNLTSTTIIITDIDGVIFRFVEAMYMYPESVGVGTVCIEKVGLTDQPLTIMINGALPAELGGAVVTQQLTFAPNETMMCVNFTVMDDTIALEPDVSVVFDLTLVTIKPGVSIGLPNVTTVIVMDDDELIITVSKDNIVPENDTAPEVLLTFSNEFATSFTVNVAIGQNVTGPNPPATPGADYAPTNDSVLIGLNDSAAGQRILTGTFFDDDAVESLLECFTLSVGLTVETNDVFGAVITVVNGERECCILDNDVVRIGFNPDSYSVDETEGIVTIFVSVLMGRLERPAEVELTFVSGTALAGVDFMDPVTPIPLLFDAVTTSIPITVIIIDDDFLENNEDFFSLLSTTDAAVNLIPQRATITIVEDNDEVVVEFEVPSYTVVENERMVEVCVRVASGMLQRDITVTLSSSDGQAISTGPEADFTAVAATLLTFNASQLRQCVTIPIVDDPALEDPQEDFTITITTPPGSGVMIPTPTVPVIIVDDDNVTVGLERTMYIVDEGGSVEFCAILTGELRRSVVVELNTAEGTATDPEDFDGVSEIFTFVPGGPSRMCVDVSIEDDDAFEYSENFTATLTTSDPNVIINPPMATVEIRDTDVVTVGFERTMYSTNESSGSVTVRVLVIGNTTLERTVVVDLVDVEGSATTPEDYADPDQQLTFGPGNMFVDVMIPIVDDQLREGTEVFSLLLSTTELRVNLNPDTTEITINDDDEVSFRFMPNNVREPESQGFATVCVEKIGNTTLPVSVSISSTPGTATPGSDYDPSGIPSVLMFGPSDTEICFNVTIIDDVLALEPDETIILTLSYFGGTGTDTSTVTIDDDDVVLVAFVEPSYTVREDVGTALVCLTKDLETVTPFRVDIFTTDSTAESPLDYIGGSFAVTFQTAAGDVQCQPIVIVLDSVVETADEVFLVDIDLPPTGRIQAGNPDQTMVSIQETGVRVNDTVVGDPLFTVPMFLEDSVNITLLGTDRPKLCYEVHGEQDDYFNLVTDECASVNAHYINVSDYLNVIDEIAIRAVDMNGMCKNILVSLNNCSVTVNGMSVQRMYSDGGITISRMASIRRVRVNVPNCDELSLMMRIDCETRTLEDPFVAERFLTADMMRFEVLRGLNFGHRSAHGLLGQFWNVPVNIQRYTGLLRDGNQSSADRYTITFTRLTDTDSTSFTGLLYELTWEFKQGPCLYVGNRQAGPIYEVIDPNDSVIKGEYTEYEVSGRFETSFTYGLFNETMCL